MVKKKNNCSNFLSCILSDLYFIAESLLERAEQWNSWAPDPSKILCKFLSVIPPPERLIMTIVILIKLKLITYTKEMLKDTWHDSDSPFSLWTYRNKRWVRFTYHLYTHTPPHTYLIDEPFNDRKSLQSRSVAAARQHTLEPQWHQHLQGSHWIASHVKSFQKGQRWSFGRGFQAPSVNGQISKVTQLLNGKHSLSVNITSQ